MIMAMDFLIIELILENSISPFNFWNFIRWIILINPYFSYSSCIVGFLKITWTNKICEVCKSLDSTDECYL